MHAPKKSVSALGLVLRRSRCIGSSMVWQLLVADNVCRACVTRRTFRLPPGDGVREDTPEKLVIPVSKSTVLQGRGDVRVSVRGECRRFQFRRVDQRKECFQLYLTLYYALDQIDPGPRTGVRLPVSSTVVRVLT
jgi:hypothetical protein